VTREEFLREVGKMLMSTGIQVSVTSNALSVGGATYQCYDRGPRQCGNHEKNVLELEGKSFYSHRSGRYNVPLAVVHVMGLLQQKMAEADRRAKREAERLAQEAKCKALANGLRKLSRSSSVSDWRGLIVFRDGDVRVEQEDHESVKLTVSFKSAADVERALKSLAWVNEKEVSADE
jgi:hypothetical protein